MDLSKLTNNAYYFSEHGPEDQVSTELTVEGPNRIASALHFFLQGRVISAFKALFDPERYDGVLVVEAILNHKDTFHSLSEGQKDLLQRNLRDLHQRLLSREERKSLRYKTIDKCFRIIFSDPLWSKI